MHFSLHDNKNPYRVYTYYSHPRPLENCKDGAKKCDYHFGVFDHIIPNISQTAARREEELRRRARTPEAVQGRKHMSIQTDVYIETLRDIPENTDITCQTDDIMDIPAQLVKPPKKMGQDVATRIMLGELFDFEEEVQPVLEILIGRTIEQSLLEVMEEEELVFVWAQFRAFQALRNSELAEVQRLREHERRHREEKQRRFIQLREAIMKEQETAEKIAARAFTREMLANLFPAIFTSLRRDGFFYDQTQQEIEKFFLPWLVTKINNNVDTRFIARRVMDDVIYRMVQDKFEAQ
uniref:Radial spoke head 3 n=1 Tax=Cynoglossus semilaevis TaxID=244447 RepID=A0A3P8VWK5_CYNSE